jgi:hypothetical protein
MERLILNLIMSVAAISATTVAARAQGQASADERVTHRPTEASADMSDDDWGIDYSTPAGPAQRITEAATSTKGPKTFASLDWLDQLDRRITRQEDLFSHAFAWTQRVVGALALLFGGWIAYLTIRLSKLAASGGLGARSDSSAAARREEVGVISAATRPAVGASLSASTSVQPKAPVTGVPRVQFRSGVIDRLAAGINESRRRRGTVETGYALVGKISGEGSRRIISVTGLIEEGPQSDRSGGHHRADREYQQQELELLQLVDGETMFIGDCHLHPGSLDTCSGGDYRTDSANVRESYSQEMVFVIVTAETAHWGAPSSHGLCCHGLNLNFYYLGKSSCYEYQRFRPEVIEGPALLVPVELRRFAAADPIRTKLDFDNLRRLAAYRMTVGEVIADGQPSRACIVMTHKIRGFKAMIAYSGDPCNRPDVFVEKGSHLMQFQPPYLSRNCTASPLWFTPIVLDIEREMNGLPSVGAGNNNSPRAGERSAPAGAKASGSNGDE